MSTGCPNVPTRMGKTCVSFFAYFMNQITILIVTRNRPKELARCIRSIFASTFRAFTISIFDQSDDDATKRMIDTLHSHRIVYIRSAWQGKAKALNILVDKAKTDILVFTDDDCIVKPNWLATIAANYRKYPRIAGVFGNTLPYKVTIHPR